MLEAGGTALDAVEASVRYLEDDPLFNAGRGGVLNEQGRVTTDAAMMDGTRGDAGCVTGCFTVKNPITLARSVMERGDVVFLSSLGAEAYADALGPDVVERRDAAYFITERRRRALDAALSTRRSGGATTDDPSASSTMSIRDDAAGDPEGLRGIAMEPSTNTHDAMGTVGAVAKDCHGNLAAATSTGGRNAKPLGRVGDTPVIGAGTYANDTVAVSGTGWGESFIRRCVCYDVAARMEYSGCSLAHAAAGTLSTLPKGDGGFIAVDSDGNIEMPFNSLGMYRAAADSTGYQEVLVWPK